MLLCFSVLVFLGHLLNTRTYVEKTRSMYKNVYSGWVVLVVLLTGSCSSNGGTADLKRDFSGAFESGERTRNYVGLLPESYDGEQPAPLLIAFHGVPGTGAAMQEGANLDRVAAQRGWITVYPSATSDWAEGCDGCAKADREGVNDVQFVADLVDVLDERYAIDRRRVYVLGYSQGGLFTQRLACEWTEHLAGVVVVAATMSVPLASRCIPEHVVPIVIVHGTNDTVFPWAGNLEASNFSTLSAPEVARRWADWNRCNDELLVNDSPEEAQGAEVRLERFTQCAGGVEVRLYGVQDGPHAWPSFGVEALAIDFLQPFSR